MEHWERKDCQDLRDLLGTRVTKEMSVYLDLSGQWECQDHRAIMAQWDLLEAKAYQVLMGVRGTREILGSVTVFLFNILEDLELQVHQEDPYGSLVLRGLQDPQAHQVNQGLKASVGTRDPSIKPST